MVLSKRLFLALSVSSLVCALAGLHILRNGGFLSENPNGQGDDRLRRNLLLTEGDAGLGTEAARRQEDPLNANPVVNLPLDADADDTAEDSANGEETGLNELTTAAEKDSGGTDHEVSKLQFLEPWNFDGSRMRTETAALVAFMTPWCTYSQMLAPDYKALTEEMQGHPVVIAMVDCEKHPDICEGFNIDSYPTLLWFTADHGRIESYHGSRDVQSLKEFVHAKIGILKTSSLT